MALRMLSGPASGASSRRESPAGAARRSLRETAGTAAPDRVDVTGAEALIMTLERQDCEFVFGVAGDPLLTALHDRGARSGREELRSPTRPVPLRHEQDAGHAATGYAQATGNVGVCASASGPGAASLVTSVADAHMDSVPLVVLTAGTDARSPDMCAISMPITKHNLTVTSAAEVPRAIAEAFHIAAAGRPGPVLVDIPADVLRSRAPFSWHPVRQLPGYRPTVIPNQRQVLRTAALLGQSSRPLLYVGGGVIKADASRELAEVAELTGAPVVTTLMARGAFPDSHPQHLGMPGMHGSVAAVAAMQECDLLIALGARFDDRVTGKLESFAPGARVVHADIDPAEISKNRYADVPIVGDCQVILRRLADTIGNLNRRPDLAAWWHRLDEWRTEFPLGYEWPPDGALSPQYVIERICALAGPDTVYTSGVGQHQMWAAQFIQHERPRNWINSGGLGTMGFAVPAAIGAKCGRPESAVWAIDGDGCFQMTAREMAACAAEEIPVKVAVINNGSLGMVRQWQDLFYRQRYSETDLGGQVTRVPNFVALAESMGCDGIMCQRRDEVDDAITRARDTTGRPVVIDFHVGKDAQVWPMVPAGMANDELMAVRGMRPLLEREG